MAKILLVWQEILRKKAVIAGLTRKPPLRTEPAPDQ
jgi:hypothetical protein